MDGGSKHANLAQVLDWLEGGTDAARDARLLARFVGGRDEAAFTALVHRHGGMVLGVCRRVLRDWHDAEDAFQAVFLILARKASNLGRCRSLASWLYTVAHRTSLKARTGALRRRKHELRAASLPRSAARDEPADEELGRVLDATLQSLPEKYRAPLVLCCLQGKTHEAAARELGWPAGSMARRLTRARELLRERLMNRGVTAAPGLLGPALAGSVVAQPALIEGAVRAATAFVAGGSAVGGAVSPRAATLAKGVIRGMFLNKMKMASAAFLVLATVGVGLAWQALPAAGGRPELSPAARGPARRPQAGRQGRGRQGRRGEAGRAAGSRRRQGGQGGGGQGE